VARDLEAATVEARLAGNKPPSETIEATTRRRPDSAVRGGGVEAGDSRPASGDALNTSQSHLIRVARAKVTEQVAAADIALDAFEALIGDLGEALATLEWAIHLSPDRPSAPGQSREAQGLTEAVAAVRKIVGKAWAAAAPPETKRTARKETTDV
jgi:hypothetical protein